MKFDWFDIILILFGLFMAYQLLRIIVGGSWQMEALLIGLLMFNLGLTWKIAMKVIKLDVKFDGHITWHKRRE